MAHRRKGKRRGKHHRRSEAVEEAPPVPAVAHKEGDVVGGQYVLGPEVGRGGFGAVYKAQHVSTKNVVAVKHLPLRSVEADVASMEMEITLLRKLDHPNIVKYVDSFRETASFYIVLEFVENGSLAQTIKKFGHFTETLAAMFVSQILEGLAYLHDQGVIHRDIKGANILTTTEGFVKLADFGVAVSDTEKSNSVVGTPYWMAPEIIEMSGPSAACDVWSVGCTVIELLTGKPPYFDLAPMTALFRIVQDDYPPIPDDISPALADFLAECFKKEPMFRKSASELLKHPWLVVPLKSREEARGALQQTMSPPLTSSDPMSLELSSGAPTVHRLPAATPPALPHPIGNRLPSAVDPSPAGASAGGAGDDAAALFAAKHTTLSIRATKEELQELGSVLQNTMHNTVRLLRRQQQAGGGGGAAAATAAAAAGGSGSAAGAGGTGTDPSSGPSPVMMNPGTSSTPTPSTIKGLPSSVSPTTAGTAATTEPTATPGANTTASATATTTSSHPTPAYPSPFPAGGRHNRWDSVVANPGVDPDDGFDDEDWDAELSGGVAPPRSRLVLPGLPPEASSNGGGGGRSSVDPTPRHDEDWKPDDTVTSLRNRHVMDEMFLDDDDDADDDSEAGMRLLEQSHRVGGGGAGGIRMSASDIDAALGPDDDFEVSHVGDMSFSVAQLPLTQSKVSNTGGERAQQLSAFADDDAEEDWSDMDFNNSRLTLGGGGLGGNQAASSSSSSSNNNNNNNNTITTATTATGDDDGAAAAAGFDDMDDEELQADRLRRVLQRRMASSSASAGGGPSLSTSAGAASGVTASAATVAFPDDLAFQDDMFEDHEFERDNERDILNKQQTRVMTLTRIMADDPSEARLLDVCHELADLFTAVPSLRRYVVKNHGVHAMLDVLSVWDAEPLSASDRSLSRSPATMDSGAPPSRQSPPVIEAVLSVINLIVKKDKRLQESLSLIGVLPAVVKFARATYPPRVRLEAARFVEHLCTSSQITLQMFVACGGVQVLVNLLHPSTDVSGPPASASADVQHQEQELLRIALSGIVSVFGLKTVTKNEFYRLFLRVGLLAPLSRALREAFLFLCRRSAPSTHADGTLAATSAAVISSARAGISSVPATSGGLDLSDTDSDDSDGALALDFKTLGVASSGHGTATTRRDFGTSPRTRAATFGAFSASPPSADAHSSPEAEEESAKAAMVICSRIVEVLLLFSQGDQKVKESMSSADTIAPLLRMLRPAPLSLLSHPMYAPCVVRVLKTIKHLSMDLGALEVLGQLNAVGMLAPFLIHEGMQVVSAEVAGLLSGMASTLSAPRDNSQPSVKLSAAVAAAAAAAAGSTPGPSSSMSTAGVGTGAASTPVRVPGGSSAVTPGSGDPLQQQQAGGHWALNMGAVAESATDAAQLAKDVQNHVVHALFYLCRVNRWRQEEAAIAGIIPPLQKIVQGQGALKQMALSILCEFAHAGNKTRDILWEVGGVEMYVSLLKEPYWKIIALTSLSTWLTHDTDRVEGVLLRPASIRALTTLFRDAQKGTFESLLAPFRGMLVRCAPLARALGSEEEFMTELAHRLQVTKALVLHQLLRMLQAVLMQRRVSPELVARLDLKAIVMRHAMRDEHVLMQGLATMVLSELPA